MPTKQFKVNEYPAVQGSRESRIYHIQFPGACIASPSAVVVCAGLNVSGSHLTYAACMTSASLVEVGAVHSLCPGKEFRVLVGAIVGGQARWCENKLEVWDQGFT